MDIDLPDVVAQTSVEMKRNGWTIDRGRQYLIRTYGKRSRPELTQEELLEFLHYLESLPSPTSDSSRSEKLGNEEIGEYL